jgi:hypothetical protein
VSRLRTAQIAARTLWIIGALLRAGGGSEIFAWWVLAFIGVDVVLAHARNPTLLRRPSRAEIAEPIQGVLAMAILIAVAAIVLTLAISG